MSDVGHNYRVTSGTSSLAADLTGNPTVVAGISGAKLSLKRVILAAVANTNFIIQEETTGTDLWIMDVLARQSRELNFAPGQKIVSADGLGIAVDTDVSTAASVYIECWVHPS